MPLKSTTLFLVFAIAMLVFNISLALAQSAAQHNGPNGPKEKVERFVNQYGLTLPPPPPTPPAAPVSTSSVTSTPAAPSPEEVAFRSGHACLAAATRQAGATIGTVQNDRFARLSDQKPSETRRAYLE